MLAIHELAHITVASILQYPVTKITIYPFGLCAEIKHMGKGSIGRELCIIIAGPLMHCFYPFFFKILMQFDVISMNYMQYLMQLNAAIFIFNMLPIFPLDGGRILQSFYHIFLPYTFAQKVTYITSLVMLITFTLFQLMHTYSANVACLFLLIQLFLEWKALHQDVYSFYQYRMQHPKHGKLHSHRKKDLYRSCYNIMHYKEHWIMEEDWLKIQLAKFRKKLIYKKKL